MNRKQKKLLDKHRNTLMYVEVKGKSVEKAISLFKKRVKNANLMKQIRDNEFYEKPSAKRLVFFFELYLYILIEYTVELIRCLNIFNPPIKVPINNFIPICKIMET